MATLVARVVPLPGSSLRLIERNFLVYRRGWITFLTGFLEPILYLLSIGVGVSGLVGSFRLPNGDVVSYTHFVAPAVLAASSMNGALFDSTYNIFFRLTFDKLYDAVLATPMSPRDVAVGEVGWALLRGTAYSAGFVVVMSAMGLVSSWWTILALPAAMLIGFAFAGTGMALTTWMRTWQDFEFVQLAILPMFLFSGTFYPLAAYPGVLRWIVEVTPLYQGVTLCRSLTTGSFSAATIIGVAYLAAMGTLGLLLASRRLARLLLR